jgi:phage gp36-like protein
MSYTAYADLPTQIQNDIITNERWGIPATPTAARDAAILLASNRAKGIIHAYLGRRYASLMPFTDTTIPLVVQWISDALTIWFLAAGRQTIGEAYIADYTAAMDTLKMIANNKIDIFSENDDTLLSDKDSTYGILTDSIDDSQNERTDEWEDDHREFPRSLLSSPPASLPKTYKQDT